MESYTVGLEIKDYHDIHQGNLYCDTERHWFMTRRSRLSVIDTEDYWKWNGRREFCKKWR